MKTYTYGVEIERDEDGIYVVSVPALPGCFTHGRTYEEVLTRSQEAIQAYLGSLIKHDDPIPAADISPTTVRVSVLATDPTTSWIDSRK